MSDALRLDRFSVLADVLLGGYEPEDGGEAEPLTARDLESIELAAAAIDLAFEDAPGVMPEAVRRRLEQSADAFMQEAARPAVVVRPGATGVMWGGWLAAAAVAVAASSLYVSRPASGPSGGTSIATIANAPDARAATWSDWSLNGDGPEVAGVTGEVVWSEQSQRGVMRFSDLPPLAEDEVYQVWIVDHRGLFDPSGQSARISGGVFSRETAQRDPETGLLVVPIDPGIEVQDAAAFAVTIEKPGGTWVSDMSRRVVIAQLKS